MDKSTDNLIQSLDRITRTLQHERVRLHKEEKQALTPRLLMQQLCALPPECKDLPLYFTADAAGEIGIIYSTAYYADKQAVWLDARIPAFARK